MAKKPMSLLEEQTNYLLEEGVEGEDNKADNETAQSGENKKYGESLKALQESKKHLIRAQAEFGDEDELEEEDQDKKDTVDSALEGVNAAIKSLKQESKEDGEDDDDNGDEDGDAIE